MTENSVASSCVTILCPNTRKSLALDDIASESAIIDVSIKAVCVCFFLRLPQAPAFLCMSLRFIPKYFVVNFHLLA